MGHSVICMIPARMGSQRLKRKNLRHLNGVPLITRAIRKCVSANVFKSVWVNSEHQDFAAIAQTEGVNFHRRSEFLADNQATSEEFVLDFLNSHDCDFLVQVHSIAPLLSLAEIRGFTETLIEDRYDTQLSIDNIQIECAYRNKPINFSFTQKSNSQDLLPVQKIAWSITGWRRSTYLDASNSGKCATYSGRVGFYQVSSLAGHVIKTENDLQIAEALLPLLNEC